MILLPAAMLQPKAGAGGPKAGTGGTGGGATELPASELAFLLVGGRHAGEGALATGEGHALLWAYGLGTQCGADKAADAAGGAAAALFPIEEADAPCALNERCDAALGLCVCVPGAACGDPPEEPWVQPAALRQIVRAWAVVGISVVGGLLGNAGQAAWRRWRVDSGPNAYLS